MKKNEPPKPAAIDAMLALFERTIRDIQAKIKRRSWDLQALEKQQRADRYTLGELMKTRRSYLAIKAALIKNGGMKNESNQSNERLLRDRR